MTTTIEAPASTLSVVCNRGALLDALSVVAAVIPGRTPQPTLQCVKLTAKDNALYLAGTDLSLSIRFAVVQVEVSGEGDALVPADLLLRIVKESTDDTLRLSVEGGAYGTDGSLFVRGTDAEFRLLTQPVGNFPPVTDGVAEEDAEFCFTLPEKSLASLVRQTAFAAATESTRYAFNGIYVVPKGNRVSFVATDGRRLALAVGEMGPGDKAAGVAGVVVPVRAMAMAVKLAGDDDVTVRLGASQASFRTPRAVLTTTLVEGQFPPYDDIIPKDCGRRMTAAVGDFLHAVRQASLLTTEQSKGVRMAFGKRGLVLTSRNPDSGEATINFACKFEGEGIEIGFNPDFLADGLKAVEGDECTFEMDAPNRPGLLRCGPEFLYVLMPIALAK